MRSIRRSLLGYLLVLLALALSAVGLLVDRFANGAIRQREASEEGRIEQTFKVRQSEAKTKFDADLMAEAKSLAKEAHYKTQAILGQNHDFRRGPPRMPDAPVRAPEEEARQYRLRAEMMLLANTRLPLPTALTVSALEPRRGAVFGPFPNYPGAPGWIAFDAPRAIPRIHDALRKSFEEEEHPGHFQITLLATVLTHPGRTVLAVQPARLPGPLPLDPAWLEPSALEFEPRIGDLEIPGKGTYRRVVTTTLASGRPLAFGVWLPPPATPTNPNPISSYRPSFVRPDLSLRLVVHAVRPYSELDARLAADQADRDEQLARVREETRAELAQLRARLILIGTGTFAALVLGGWFFVARGLSPLRKLSDAVSRVSEKDFHLTVEAAELGRELAPIHARLTQTLTLLQRAFAREKQAVADISHELRTPIAALLATIDVALRKKNRTADEYRTALEECRPISKQLGQLVERIMTLASLDAGNDHTSATRTDAVELAGGCAAVIRPLAAANNVTVATHLPDELVLETDAAKLREVLMNLLHNAVEYNTPGGTIDLTARRDGTSAVFEVRDTGIGMSAEVREKIFERFYRADASRSATGVHAGLGLAIVKEYVARLGGAIAVESAPGVGTTFRVTIPLAPASAPPAPPPSDRTRPRDAVAASS